jgi:TolB-like protein
MKSMKKKIILCLLVLALPYYARADEGKKVFISGFTAHKNIENKKLSADNVFKEEFLNAGYRITDINAIKAGISAEELKMSLGSNDENSLKRVLESGDVDYIAYGYIRIRGSYVFITAKMLDKSNGNVKLEKIKSVSIRNEISEQFFKEACTVLAGYIISGDTKKVLKFQDKVLAEEKRYEIANKQQKLQGEENEDRRNYQNRIDEYKKLRKETITKHDAVFRSAFNPFGVKSNNEAFDKSFKEGRQFFIELDLPLFTDTIGLDLMARYTCRYFSKRDTPFVATTLDDKKFDRDWERGRSVFDSWGVGMRLRLNGYFLMTEFDLYGIGAIGMTETSFSAIYGGGIEIAFFPYVGFFVEYNRGWSSVGDLKLNVENNNQLLIGAALRW